jgi:hypothetical protein
MTAPIIAAIRVRRSIIRSFANRLPRVVPVFHGILSPVKDGNAMKLWEQALVVPSNLCEKTALGSLRDQLTQSHDFSPSNNKRYCLLR